MEYPYIKNITHEKVQSLAGLVNAEDGQIVSKTLAQNEAVSVTLFAFAKGEEIVKEIPKADISVMTDEVRELFKEQGYTADNTILIEFSYNATESGTTSAYLDTMKIINTMKSEYTHLFYSETDVSVFAG